MVERIAGEVELEFPLGLEVEIDAKRELEGTGLCGYTWPDGARMTLYPDAFRDRETLLRTLVHERCHVRQIRVAGAPADSATLAAREREAYAEEEEWWMSFQSKH